MTPQISIVIPKSFCQVLRIEQNAQIIIACPEGLQQLGGGIGGKSHLKGEIFLKGSEQPEGSYFLDFQKIGY
jgi:hypothetical protein